jgi:hypothetical protein
MRRAARGPPARRQQPTATSHHSWRFGSYVPSPLAECLRRPHSRPRRRTRESAEPGDAVAALGVHPMFSSGSTLRSSIRSESLQWSTRTSTQPEKQDFSRGEFARSRSTCRCSTPSEEWVVAVVSEYERTSDMCNAVLSRCGPRVGLHGDLQDASSPNRARTPAQVFSDAASDAWFVTSDLGSRGDLGL